MKKRCGITISIDEDQLKEYYQAKKKSKETNVFIFMTGVRLINKNP